MALRGRDGRGDEVKGQGHGWFKISSSYWNQARTCLRDRMRVQGSDYSDFKDTRADREKTIERNHINN